ncbi:MULTISPECIES: GGGtGRT protein [unclassified Clostridium]|nr:MULTISPECIES: GGGtGRT protein [unclassified Clostridium]
MLINTPILYMGNNPMVGCTVAVAVEEGMNK